MDSLGGELFVNILVTRYLLRGIRRIDGHMCPEMANPRNNISILHQWENDKTTINVGFPVNLSDFRYVCDCMHFGPFFFSLDSNELTITLFVRNILYENIETEIS